MQAEIGFTIAAAVQGNGYGQEAVRKMLEHLFIDVGLHKISAECDARNGASAHLLSRVGFRQEGLLRSHTFAKGEWTDDMMFGLLADEYAPPDLATGHRRQTSDHGSSNNFPVVRRPARSSCACPACANG